jgi:hypothetical protein
MLKLLEKMYEEYIMKEHGNKKPKMHCHDEYKRDRKEKGFISDETV